MVTISYCPTHLLIILILIVTFRSPWHDSVIVRIAFLYLKSIQRLWDSHSSWKISVWLVVLQQHTQTWSWIPKSHQALIKHSLLKEMLMENMGKIEATNGNCPQICNIAEIILRTHHHRKESANSGTKLASTVQAFRNGRGSRVAINTIQSPACNLYSCVSWR